MNRTGKWLLLIATLLLGACATQPDVVGDASQVQMRQIQTRQYDVLDKSMTMRSVIATLQDLGFVIDAADSELGTISATRLNQHTMRITVSVVERDNQRISVRANARMDENSVTDARTYQDFFIALDKAVFLTQNRVD